VKIFMKGNEAIAESAIRAGCRFYAGYPITPQNEIPEYMALRLREEGGVFVQGESEIAAIYMVMGGASMGTRCMTSSSGLGLSLKSEGLSYLAGSRLPAVVVDVMRGGPAIGSIGPAQQDYNFINKGLGSGGFSCMVLAPSTVQEAADLTGLAFELADRDRNPVILLLDGCIGAMMEDVALPEPKATSAHAEWSLAKSERPFRMFTSFRLEMHLQEQFNCDMAELYNSWEEDVRYEEYQMADAEYVIVAYGVTARVAKTVIGQLREQGHKIGLLRPITLTPFPRAYLGALSPDAIKGVLATEMSVPGQMVVDVKNAVDRRIPVEFYGRSAGMMVDEAEMLQAALKMMQ